jgi:hypothetical protein
MEEPTSSKPDSTTTSVEEIKRKTAMAELRKLDLEIEGLERGRDWEGRVARFVPILTAVISIGGFILGVVIFGNQQARERQARVDDRRSRELNDYRTGYEQLLQFSSNDKMTIARVLALKQDLDALKNSLYLTPKEKDEQEKRLTGSICNLIARDFDFTQPRQVTFDIAALQNWDEYKNGLADTLNKDGTGKTVNQAIIDKYLQVVRELNSKDPGVFEDVDLDEGASDPEILLSEPHRSVIYGFACHLNLERDKKLEDEIDKFERATTTFERGIPTKAYKISAALRKGLPCPPIPAIPARPALPTS